MGDRSFVGVQSYWVNGTQFNVRAYRLRDTNKFLVDVTELAHNRVQRKGTALSVARLFARNIGVSCMDATILSVLKADKEIGNTDGKKCVVKIRISHFVFHGVE